MKYCEDCIWFDRCDGPAPCPDFHPVDETDTYIE